MSNNSFDKSMQSTKILKQGDRYHQVSIDEIPPGAILIVDSDSPTGSCYTTEVPIANPAYFQKTQVQIEKYNRWLEFILQMDVPDYDPENDSWTINLFGLEIIIDRQRNLQIRHANCLIFDYQFMAMGNYPEQTLSQIYVNCRAEQATIINKLAEWEQEEHAAALKKMGIDMHEIDIFIDPQGYFWLDAGCSCSQKRTLTVGSQRLSLEL